VVRERLSGALAALDEQRRRRGPAAERGEARLGSEVEAVTQALEEVHRPPNGRVRTR
jgi:hypothetical protein